MKQLSDLIEVINERAVAFYEETSRKPSEIAVSAEAYRRLLEMKAESNKIGNLLIGCAPIVRIETSLGTVHLAIDEMLSATEIAVS